MDEIDFIISMILMVNSRSSYRELAELFEMSVNSIHKRVKSMVDLGIIQNFKTRLSLFNFPNSANIIAFGVSKAKDPKAIIEKLGSHECVYNVTQASSNLFYTHSYIRSINQLDALVTFIRNEGEIDELIIGIEKQKFSIDNEFSKNISLSDLDYLIIDALKDNARKPVADIADEIGVSTKTVRRHLDLLIEKNLVLFTIDWYPDKTSVFLSFIILRVEPGRNIDEEKLMDELRNRYGQKVLFSWSFSNLPDLIIICIWISIMKELQDIENFLRTKEVESVDVTVLVEGKNFPTWQETFLNDKIKKIKEKKD
ncbi:MAG: winged helix-turn-helix transcriptional regulator [Candidatus Thorarchaeota archaeon]